MKPQAILITGGGGFIGSSLAIALGREFPSARIVALDNLRRRGSELTTRRLREAGIAFVHGDVRCPDDLTDACPRPEVIIDCAAEPAVGAGRDGRARYVIDANLNGAVNCLELARKQDAQFVFLSTSRVYPHDSLNALHLDGDGRRFTLRGDESVAGVSANGIAESFPLQGRRTLYGATKLAGELLVQEYADLFGLRAIVNRCGVVSGPWQMGRAEQGVCAHWIFAHLFGRPLSYIGYGGHGEQVRDVLHVDDLCRLIVSQLHSSRPLAGEVFNVGGGAHSNTSLAELTDLCVALTGARVPIDASPDTRPGDIPFYVSDTTKVSEWFGWTPRFDMQTIMKDLCEWARAHGELLHQSGL